MVRRAGRIALAVFVAGCGSSGADQDPPSSVTTGADAGATPTTPCQEMLRADGIVFQPTTHEAEHPDLDPALTCTVEDPVLLDPVVHGVTFRPSAASAAPKTIFAACNLARAIARTAKLLAASDVNDVVHYGTYACRPIAGTTMLSEHAFARAFDLAEFRLTSGATYTVLADWEKDNPAPGTAGGMFLRTLATRLYGDGIYNILLTPDYNAAHANHFHGDLTQGARFTK
jgi:hypothetical protein